LVVAGTEVVDEVETIGDTSATWISAAGRQGGDACARYEVNE
jgi:hypothetical protein